MVFKILLTLLLVSCASAQNCEYDTEECPCFGRANVVGLVDTTGSIDSAANYNNLKSFVKGVFNKLGLGDNGIITAGVTFANHPNTVWDFSSTTSISHPEICYAVDNYFPAPKGQTQTHEAIAEAQSLLAGVNRPFAADVVFLVTDGGSENKALTQSAVNSIRAAVPGVKFCVASVRDPEESDVKKANRDTEIAYFVGDNGENINVNLFADLPTIIDEAVECICSVASPPCCEPPPPPPATETPPPPDTPKPPCKLDVLFIVDRTGSIKKVDFPLLKQFVSGLGLALSSYDTKYGLISFSNKANVLLPLGGSYSALDAAVALIDDPSGQTNTWFALDAATAEYANGRPGARWLCVLITDGGSDDKALTQTAATNLKAAGVSITVVSIRDPAETPVKKANRDAEVAGLISGGGANFDADGFSDLDGLTSTVSGYLSDDCGLPPPPPPPYIPPPPPVCRADVAIVVDRTGSIDQGVGFPQLKQFVNDILAGLSTHDVLTALLSFSNKAKLEYGFKSGYGLSAQQAAVGAIASPRGQTYTDLALVAALAEFSNSRGAPIPKFCVLITDGGSDHKQETQDAAQDLKDAGVKLIVVSIRLSSETPVQTSNRNTEINGLISGSGVNFNVADFGALSGTTDKVVKEICP